VIAVRRLLIAACALALAACSGGGDVARVGDAVIHIGDIEALFETGAVPAEDFREVLYRVVAVEALTQGLAAEYGGVVDQEAVEDYLVEFETAREQQGATPGEFLGIDNASLGMVRFTAGLAALYDAVIEARVADPEVVDDLFADPATLTTVCVKHILVASQEAAEAVQGRLAAGEDFAAVADEVSLDTAAEGGDLGCARAAKYVPVFAQAALAAPLGELTGPVQSSFGFHLLIVSERSTPTREEYLADPPALLSEEDLTGLWNAWLSEVLQAADVWVAEEYGTWSPGSILAPGTETTGTLPGG